MSSILSQLKDDGDEDGLGAGSPASDAGTPLRARISHREVDFQDEGEYVGDDPEGIFSYVTPVTLGIACAGVAAVTLIIIVVVVMWLRTRRRRQKLLQDLTFDDCSEESKSTKSAPTSRTPSPKFNKRMSCPDALSTKTCARGMLVRSVTSDRIPDFTLPPERVQPRSAEDRRGSSKFTFSAPKRNDSIGSITPDLYHHQSFSEDDEPNLPETSHGRLWFSVVYDAAVEQLQVTLVKVKDIPGRNNNAQPRDPFVKIFLLPDEKTYRVSKVKKKTLSPVFNETHTFQVSSEEVKKRVLRFSVYDVDKRRVRHSLGHVMINLKSIDLTRGDTMWSDLEPMVQAATSLGEVQFSLIYLPTSEKIKIGIHQAKNLNYMDDYPDMGAYIRVQLFCGHKCHRTKRSIIRQGGADIAFNESLAFTVNGRQLDSCSMVITLVLTSPRAYGTTELEYGRVVIGPFMYARGDELVHWQEMVSQPKTASTRWHTLTNIPASSP